MSGGVPPSQLELHEGLQPRTEAGRCQLQSKVRRHVDARFALLAAETSRICSIDELPQNGGRWHAACTFRSHFGKFSPARVATGNVLDADAIVVIHKSVRVAPW